MKNTQAATFKRAMRTEKIVTLLLLFILLTAATASVSAVLTGPNWSSLWSSLFLGLLIGWILAIFHWPAWRAILLVILMGIIFCLLVAAGLNVKIFAVFDEFTRLVGNLIATMKAKELDVTPLNQSLEQLNLAARVVLGRVSAWVGDLANQQPNFDPVAAGIVWSFVVWLIAAWAGWMIEAGKNALAAVLPATLLCLATLSYAKAVSATIYMLLGLTLVLIAVVQYDHREQIWNETRVAYPARKAREVGNLSILLTIFLVLLAAILSSVSLQRISRLTTEIRGNRPQGESGLAKSLGIVPAITATPDSFSNIRSPGLPRELLIGSGPELSREIVMSIQINNMASLVVDGQQAPLYWRSFTYDIYTGQGWSSSPTQQTQYQPDQAIQPSQLVGHALIQEQVGLLPGAEGYIYAAGEPVSVDVSTNAAWRSSNDLFGIQAASNGYTIQSLVATANENTLRTAGQDYPDWIVKRYLALPDEVPTRVKQLAIQLTATEPTPYDRARAIEQYLRLTYPYSLDLPRPPSNQDLVSYFLFNLRKGYCDYYASAMVVLARAAGIPARLATGYASGTLSERSLRFIVTQADAHSWAEIYFPNIGWVPFEPTAGLPAINRTAQPTESATTPLPTPTVTPAVGTSRITFGKYTGWMLMVTVAVLGAGWIVWDELKLSRLNPRQAAVEVYRRVQRYAARLDVPSESGDTPYELSNRLCVRLAEISNLGWMAPTGRTTIEATQVLIRDIVQLSYQPKAPEQTESGRVSSQWRALRWKLRLMWTGKIWVLMRNWIRRDTTEEVPGEPAQPG